MFYIILISAYVFLFFILVPGLGAISVRKRWRTFRKTLVHALSFPLFSHERVVAKTGYLGEFRCFGTLEAVEENDSLWLVSENSSVFLDLRGESVFVLPTDPEKRVGDKSDASVQQIHWKRAGVLTEGLGICVIGSVFLASGIPRFSRKAGKDFMVLMFDGKPETVLKRALWSGRQPNEYWNEFTPFSLLTGFVALLALSFLGFREEGQRVAAVFAAGLSLIPFLPLIPPGIVFFFLYRRLWRQGRILRARRDMLQLGQHILASEAIVANCGYCVEPQGEGLRYFAQFPRDPMAPSLVVEGNIQRLLAKLRFQAGLREALGLGLLMIGMTGNLYLVLVLISQVIKSST